MIETEQSATVARGIDAVWDYVRDFSRWAEIMPGYQGCEAIDADTSVWTLKVGVGGLVRTVRVSVDVLEWAGPGLVRFAYKLAGDPVAGSGTYRAEALGPAETRFTLAVRVEGSGPMAPMWEAMGRPLLPQFAAAFAAQLGQRIEQAVPAPAGVGAAAPVSASIPATGWLARLLAWLAALVGRPA